MNESMRKIVYYENILEFKENTKSELHLNEVNNWEICRTCLVESKDSDWDLKKMCVMDVFNGKFINAQDMLGKVVGTQFHSNDNLPDKLCKDCLEKLTTLYFYTMQVKKAEKVLKNLSIKLRGKKEEVEESVPNSKDLEDNSGSETEELGNNDLENDKDPVEIIKKVEENNERPQKISDRKSYQCKDPPPPSKIEVKNSSKRKKSGSPKGLKVRESKRKTPLFDYPDEQEYSSSDDQENLDTNKNLGSKKESPCNIPIETESVNSETNNDHMDENDEGYEVFLTDDQYNFEVTGNSNDNEHSNNTAETADTTVEVYISEDDVEGENSLEEKYFIDDDKQNIKDETDIVGPNHDDHSDHPTRLTRSRRSRKPPPKAQFKHRQQRVTKPLLQSRRCALCKESFQLQRDLVAHVKEQHPNSKAYQCRECGQLFSYTQSLSRHMNCHKEELHKFQCNYCPKAFLRADDLTRHIRTHTGERPYKCPKCDKAFKQQGEMKQHLTTHLESRSYECDQCFCVFTSRNSLYLHRKANHSKILNKKSAVGNKKLNNKKIDCSADENTAEE